MELLKQFSQALMTVENPKLDSEAEVTTKSGYKYKYSYASLGECMRVVKDSCKPLGLAIYFSTEYSVNAGTWVVSTVLTDGENVEKLSPVPVKVDGLPQSNGSEITYAKRYSLSAAFGLVSEEDDDAQMAQNDTKSINNQATAKPTLKQAQNRLKKVLMEYFSDDKNKAEEAYNSFWQTSGFKDSPEWFENKSNELLTEMRSHA